MGVGDERRDDRLSYHHNMNTTAAILANRLGMAHISTILHLAAKRSV